MAEREKPSDPQVLRGLIDGWRQALEAQPAISADEIVRLEDQLRQQVVALSGAGLSHAEAFWVAARRLAERDDRLPELKLQPASSAEGPSAMEKGGQASTRNRPLREALVAFGLACAAAMLIKLPAFLGLPMEEYEGFYARNLSLFALPLLAGYFAWRNRLGPGLLRWLAAAFLVAIVFANVYPFKPGGDTEGLAALHLPIALWLVVGVAHAGERWRTVAGRMDFVRFTGEFFIFYVLIALGGGVLSAFMTMIFGSIDLDIEPFFESWLFPCGAMGAVLVAAWLADSRQRVVENMAPVLTRLFTPLFAAMLIIFLGTLLWTGRMIDIEREVLIAFDMLLVVVLGLVLYTLSARDAQAPFGMFDLFQLVLLVSALLADLVALWAISARISEFGFSPNRIAGLGINVILLVNLLGSAIHYIRFQRGRIAFLHLERWQTNYLSVYFFWAVVVVIVFPLVFGFS